MTLIELLVVTTVFALLAAMAFPSLKILQQRDKERRLREILTELDEAREEYRTFVINQITDKVFDAYKGKVGVAWTRRRDAAIAEAIEYATSTGLIFPPTPSKMVNPIGTSFDLATGPSSEPPPVAGSVTIVINRRFIRRIPPHPFVGWAPTAHFEFEGASPSVDFPSMITVWQDKKVASSDWKSDPVVFPTSSATGVKNVSSVGAGMAINGEITDNW